MLHGPFIGLQIYDIYRFLHNEMSAYALRSFLIASVVVTQSDVCADISFRNTFFLSKVVLSPKKLLLLSLQVIQYPIIQR